MIRRPPRSTLFPYRRSSDLREHPRAPAEGAPQPSQRARSDAQAHVTGHRARSEEHTSELQSPCNLVCRLLLEKKKKNKISLEHKNKLTTLYTRLSRRQRCAR